MTPETLGLAAMLYVALMFLFATILWFLFFVN